jgi:conjugative transfer signal peptidase TraF
VKWIVLVLTATAIAAIASPRTPILIWNATASAPIGLYELHRTHALARGDLVLAKPPANALALAAARDYLPAGVPLVKRIAALSGDDVCSFGQRIFINGNPVATRLSTDTQGRPLPSWQGYYRLTRNQVFLLMPYVPDSFDGRYFGPVRRAAILGILRPLWVH